MPQIYELCEPSNSLLIDKCQFNLTEPENLITLPSIYLYNTIVPTAISSLDNDQITSSITTQLSNDTPQKLLELLLTHNYLTSVTYMFSKIIINKNKIKKLQN